ncbi:hypothetical protein GOP47_0016775 [Adiantum capillus-veneris]|uniref:Auxin-responsive protein n=1 Tax=Adiantum capillus-veneris TaxID=13818 RepID=A0A9D4UIF9_ADICA|nr:hypothetical protein GOP47_0016775 [Adiantum capillus-veneris]
MDRRQQGCKAEETRPEGRRRNLSKSREGALPGLLRGMCWNSAMTHMLEAQMNESFQKVADMEKQSPVIPLGLDYGGKEKSMLSKADHDDAWPVSVSNKEKEVESRANCLTPSNSALTEHDYLGLSKTSDSSPVQNTQLAYSTACDECDAEDKGLECGDTELRLGIGPLGNEDASSASQPAHAIQSMPHRQFPPEIGRQIIKRGEPGLDAQCGDVLMKTAMERRQSFWPWIAPGRFMIPVPKVSAASGKRPYIEIGSENRDNNGFSTESSTQPEAVTQYPVGSQLSMVQGGLYTWSHRSSNVNWPPSKPDAIATYGTSYTLATNGSLPPPTPFKLPPTPPAPSTAASAVALHSPSSSDGRISFSGYNGQGDNRMSKAPVVGWPPVRSFRKSTMHSAAGPVANKASNASSDVPEHEDSNCHNTPDAGGGEQINKSSNKDTFFVKAKLDGVRICRKVDLTSYRNYESLLSALQDMFQGFVCDDNAKLDLLQGKNYVLTHEDKDGDWMLVGDVPWHMFVTTVKSLRIMRAGDAVGLGAKVFAKLRGQGEEGRALH